MGDVTAIAWTDHTFNPWWGCTKISPGCDNCYAAAFDHRVGGNYWDPHIAPRTLSPENWKKPLRWNRDAKAEDRFHRVFCASMADVFDNKAPDGERDRLWMLIRQTPMLHWQLLTKRPQNIAKMLPEDWGNGYQNVWLGCTVEDQAHAEERCAVLLDVPARIHFLSVEPLLGPIKLTCLAYKKGRMDGKECALFMNALSGFRATSPVSGQDLKGVDWVIVGGESGNGCRPMNPEWAQQVINDCLFSDVPVFFKQMGGRGHDHGGDIINGERYQEFPRMKV